MIAWCEYDSDSTLTGESTMAGPVVYVVLAGDTGTCGIGDTFTAFSPFYPQSVTDYEIKATDTDYGDIPQDRFADFIKPEPPRTFRRRKPCTPPQVKALRRRFYPVGLMSQSRGLSWDNRSRRGIK